MQLWESLEANGGAEKWCGSRQTDCDTHLNCGAAAEAAAPAVTPAATRKLPCALRLSVWQMHSCCCHYCQCHPWSSTPAVQHKERMPCQLQPYTCCGTSCSSSLHVQQTSNQHGSGACADIGSATSRPLEAADLLLHKRARVGLAFQVQQM